MPDHLRITFRVFAGERTLAEGKDLEALRVRLAPRVQQAVSAAASGLERSGLVAWTVGTLPPVVVQGEVRGYPALVDEGTSVALRVLGAAAQQEPVHRAGVRRLVLLSVPSPVKAVSDRLTNAEKLALSRSPHGSVSALLDDCVLAAVDALSPAGAPVRDAAAFAELVEVVRPALPDTVHAVLLSVEQVLRTAYDLQARLGGEQRPALAPAVQDLQAQLAALVHPGFVSAAGSGRLPDLVRYLRGMERRLARLPRDPVRDRSSMQRLHEVVAEWQRLPASPGRTDVRWMLEELRLSLFAQDVKTRYPVSEKRVYKAIDALL